MASRVKFRLFSLLVIASFDLALTGISVLLIQLNAMKFMLN